MLHSLTSLSLNQYMVGAVATVVLLGILIFVHEFGHFIFAKLFGVGVEIFSFGFGRRLAGFTFRGTDYRLSAIPIGGYVKMVGDDPFEEADPERSDESLLVMPVWKRLLIFFAGPAFNLLLPVVLFAGLHMVGSPEPTTWVGRILENSAAQAAGIEVGDRIVKVGNTDVRYNDELVEAIAALPPGATTSITVERGGVLKTVSTALKVEAVPDEWTGTKERNILGVAPQSAKALLGIQKSNQSPAHEAKLQTGDLVKAINGKPVRWWFEVEDALRHAGGAPVELEVERRQETKTVHVSPGHYAIPVTDADTEAGPTTSDELSAIHPGAPYGIFPAEIFVDHVVEDMPAEKAGLRANDMIYSIDGKPVHRWTDVVALIGAEDDAPKKIVVMRAGNLESFPVTPKIVSTRGPNGEARKATQIGIASAGKEGLHEETLRLGLVAAIVKGAQETATICRLSAGTLVRVFIGEIPFKEAVGGPITIMRVAAQSAMISIFHYVKVMAFISVSLGMINLVPIPILDGGHILFLSIETVRGRPVSMRFREVSQQIGMIMIFILMVFAVANDFRMWLFQ